jgi:epoxyqueuosine reductase
LRIAIDLKEGLRARLRQAGAYDVGVADPRDGYEHALPGRRPLDLWEECNSVVVFAVACPPRTNNTYLGPYAPWEGSRNIGPAPRYVLSDDHAMVRLSLLFISSIAMKGMAFLRSNGFDVSFSMPQLKLSAFEAGIGVYGRSGLILHPVLGNRLRLGGIMTDAPLEPDGRLEGFEPCEGCDMCIRACPAGALDPTKEYPHSYSREVCMARRAEIVEEGLYCHSCFSVCPAGRLKDENLLCLRGAEEVLQASRS